MPFSAIDHPNRVGVTAPSSDSSTKLATTAFAHGAISLDVFAGGGGAWTTYTPVYGAQNNSSTIFQSSVLGKWIQIGATVFWQAAVSSTNIGTASGFATISLPFVDPTITLRSGCFGRENANTGKGLTGIQFAVGSSIMAIVFDDGTNPVANGNQLSAYGFFQSS